MVWRKLSLANLKLGFILFTALHFSICLLYAFSLEKLSFINDPKDFYSGALEAENWISTFGMGHKFMSFLIYPLVKFNITIEVLFFLFSAISYKGFLMCFELIGITSSGIENKIVLLLFFMPTLHIWTASLSKEALLLSLMAIILKKVIDNNKDFVLLGALVVVFLIRPHLFFILLFSLLITFLFDKNNSKVFKKKLSLISLVSLFVFVPVFGVYFLKIDSFDINSLLTYVLSFYENTIHKQGGGSVINVVETNIFTRICYLVFMPLPFLYEMKNVFQWFVSIENLLMVIIFIKILLRYKSFRFSLNPVLIYLVLSIIIMIVFFASYLYNLGLGNRMRVMFLPYLFYFLAELNKDNLNKKFV